MANKKITELNEATSITSSDWLVMVDTGNDETKKIHPDLVGASIPIQDTAPSSPEENDLWIDTSEPEEMQEAIVNEYSESTSETYACDYVNGALSEIVESGSNTNGEYVKYADGTMICTGAKSGNTTWEDWWSFCKRSPEGSNMLFASFPQAFINGNARVSITTSHGNAVFSASYNSVQTDGFYFICYKPSTNTSTNYGIHYIAIGRWK